MKSSSIASLLFAVAAIAAPVDLDKRDLTTEVEWETVVVYTTVFEDQIVTAAAATPTAGAFYEEPKVGKNKDKPASPATTPISDAAPVTPTEAPAAPVVTPPPAAPASSSVVASEPPAAPTYEAPAPPAYTETPAAPETPSTSAAAPAPQPTAPSGGAGSGSFSGDITIDPHKGGLGACGEPMTKSDFYVAIAESAWGQSTYDTMTGKATNKWCGQKVKIYANGESVEATIMDMCPGCAGHDLDIGDAAWAALKMTEWTRIKGSWDLI